MFARTALSFFSGIDRIGISLFILRKMDLEGGLFSEVATTISSKSCEIVATWIF